MPDYGFKTYWNHRYETSDEPFDWMAARKKIALLSASSSATTTSRSVSSEIPTVERRVAVQFEEGVFEGKITKVEAHWKIGILYDDEQTEETIFPDEGIKLLADYEI
eukprot:scaffold63419_cov52-Cyclotella_meneghiniana.AAC.5